MQIAPVLKKTAIFIAKAYLVYLALIVLWIDWVLFETARPKYFFDARPFIQSAALTVTISAAISIANRSKEAIVFTIFCVAYSAFFFVFQRQAASFIALFCALAAVNFLYRNKVTEPLLAMLLVITGAWVFISLVYPTYLVVWANYVTGRKDLVHSIIEAFSVAKGQLVSTLIILPVIAAYLLGKHSYVKLYVALKSLRTLRTYKPVISDAGSQNPGTVHK